MSQQTTNQMDGRGSINHGKWIGRLCFMLIGISSTANLMDVFNPYQILVGALIGLVYGALFRIFLRWFIMSFNHKYKKENGKDGLTLAINVGMMYLIPYTIMLILATYYMRWGTTQAFVSTGLMTVGTVAVMEIGKLKGKTELRNTLATAFVSFMFSSLWIMGLAYIYQGASYLEGAVNLVRNFRSGGGF